jgi:hypothetical protein
VLIESTHGLSDWIILHCFYYGFDEKNRALLDGKGDKIFMELSVETAHELLDTLLV